MSRRMRYVALALAATVVAGSATAAVALPRDSSVRGTAAAAAFLADHDEPKVPKECFYPPQKTPTVTLKAEDRRIDRGDTAELTARVRVNSCKVQGMPVALYKKAVGETDFTLVMAGETRRNGEITFNVDNLQVTTSFYVVTPGGATFQTQGSNIVTVRVRR